VQKAKVVLAVYAGAADNPSIQEENQSAGKFTPVFTIADHNW